MLESTSLTATNPAPSSPIAQAAAYARARVEELTDQLSALDRRVLPVSSVPEDVALSGEVREMRHGLSEVAGAFYTLGDDLDVLIKRVSVTLSRLEV